MPSPADLLAQLTLRSLRASSWTAGRHFRLESIDDRVLSTWLSFRYQSRSGLSRRRIATWTRSICSANWIIAEHLPRIDNFALERRFHDLDYAAPAEIERPRLWRRRMRHRHRQHIAGILDGEAKRTRHRDRFGHWLALLIVTRRAGRLRRLFDRRLGLRRVLGARRPMFLEITSERARALILQALDRQV